MLPRILKISKTDGHRVHCLFNTGEYRVIDLDFFARKFDLVTDSPLRQLLSEEAINCQLKDGTLSFPDVKRTMKLSSGKVFEVTYDLDPKMLYDSSDLDREQEQNHQIGQLLKTARKRAGLTQEELAQRVGTSKGYISRIENNRTDIALKTLRRIVEVGLDKRLAIVD